MPNQALKRTGSHAGGSRKGFYSIESDQAKRAGLGPLCSKMKFIAPKLNIDQEATNVLIESSISALKGEVDSFAILSKDEMTYMQALCTKNGFIVQFQIGSIDEHYEFDTYLSRPQTIDLMKAYLASFPSWQGSLKYSKVNIRDFWGNLGFSLGSFCGGLVRGFKGTRKGT